MNRAEGQARLLDRALAAEEVADELRERVGDLEHRLKGVLNNDPETATRAFAWLQRCENAERLLLELRAWLRQNPSVGELLPTGYADRVKAQLKIVEILRRDQASLGERLPEDEWWIGWGGDMRVDSGWNDAR